MSSPIEHRAEAARRQRLHNDGEHRLCDPGMCEVALVAEPTFWTLHMGDLKVVVEVVADSVALRTSPPCEAVWLDAEQAVTLARFLTHATMLVRARRSFGGSTRRPAGPDD